MVRKNATILINIFIVAVISTIALVALSQLVFAFADGWDEPLYTLNILVLSIFGFLVPVAVARKEDMSSTHSESSVEYSDTPQVTNGKWRKYPKIAKLMADIESLKFIEEYLVHVQSVQSSHWLLLWSNIQKFKDLTVFSQNIENELNLSF